MKRLTFYLLVLLAISPCAVRAEFRSWTNAEGKSLDAELTKVEGDTVSLRMRNGSVTAYSQAKLSEADRTYIAVNPPGAEAAKPDAAANPTAKRKARWLKKMDKAKEEAKTTGLPILVLFTGTSWCPYCVKLENEVFSKKEFSEFANKNLVLLKLDFGPGGSTDNKEQKKLQADFGVRGFPNYFLVDAADTKLARGGYHGGIDPKAFAEWVKAAIPNNK
jgi:thiol:disulfide interchange protein